MNDRLTAVINLKNNKLFICVILVRYLFKSECNEKKMPTQQKNLEVVTENLSFVLTFF